MLLTARSRYFCPPTDGGGRFLRGLELSCRWSGRTLHVLTYGVDRRREGAFVERLAQIRVARVQRIHAIVTRLARLGLVLDADAIVASAADHTPGRPDVAAALVVAGHCRTGKEAFTRFLRDGGPADVAIEELGIDEALELGRSVGAKMSLAHPHTVGAHALVKELFSHQREAGLRGIEAWYGRYGRAQREPWVRLAKELDLVITGGSDFHGDALPEVDRTGIDLPEKEAQTLVDWLDA
jgi:predicted metal-dependent phosphoesterase TrpH